MEDERKKKKRRERGEQEERRKKERSKRRRKNYLSLSLSHPSSRIFTSIHFIELADQMKMSKLAA